MIGVRDGGRCGIHWSSTSPSSRAHSRDCHRASSFRMSSDPVGPSHITKIYACDIRGKIIKWPESYLCDRSQYVVYNNNTSGTHPIKCGVP